MTYQTAFPDFDAPEDCARLLDAGWKDQSWRNDVCPSFSLGERVALFVDYAAPELRECCEAAARFTLILINGDGGYCEESATVETIDEAIAIAADMVDDDCQFADLSKAGRNLRLKAQCLTVADARAFIDEDNEAARPCPDLQSAMIDVIRKHGVQP